MRHGGQLGDQLIELGRRADRLGNRRQRLLAGSHGGEMRGRLAHEEAPPRSELPQHHAEGVEIGRNAAGRVVGDLGRDVAGLCEHDAGDRVAAPVFAARRAEVDELRVAAVADHDVLRATGRGARFRAACRRRPCARERERARRRC